MSQEFITAAFMLMGGTMFKRANREQLRARIAIDGPAGSGKTYTALLFARELAGVDGKIAVIDTEHRSASKYSGESPSGSPLVFDVCELEHYSPSTYVNVIKAAGEAGYNVLVIDSLSHAWEGVGGALDIVDRKASSGKGGSFAAWRDVTPMHRDMVEAILASPCHVIATMRSKMAYELEEYEEGGKKKTRVNKLGTKPIQREGVEYEFDIVCDMDLEHILTVSKTRCPALDGSKASKPGSAFLAPLIKWLNQGSTPAAPPPQFKPEGNGNKGVVIGTESDPYSGSVNDPCGKVIAGEIKALAKAVGVPPAKLKEVASRNNASNLADVPYGEAIAVLEKLRARAQELEIPF